MKTQTTTNTDLNKSGIFPRGNHILVKPDAIEEYTEGGIVIPESVREPHQQAVAYGTLIAIGPDFCIHSVEVMDRSMSNGQFRVIERKTRRYSEDFAEVGDRISYASHSGRKYFGEDGETYSVMNDTDITSIVTEGVTATSIEARKPLSQ